MLLGLDTVKILKNRCRIVFEDCWAVTGSAIVPNFAWIFRPLFSRSRGSEGREAPQNKLQNEFISSARAARPSVTLLGTRDTHRNPEAQSSLLFRAVTWAYSDVAADAWDTGPPLETPRCSHRCNVHGGLIASGPAPSAPIAPGASR